MDNIVWEKKSWRCTIQIITSSKWKGGIPIDLRIPKWLVKIIDHVLQDEYCPTDNEFALINHMLDKESLRLVAEAFKIKEEHNQQNLINPEKRLKEEIYRNLWKGGQENA